MPRRENEHVQKEPSVDVQLLNIDATFTDFIHRHNLQSVGENCDCGLFL